MATLSPYKIPFLGLSVGFHTYEFELDDSFFAAYEFSEITHADIQIDLELEKQSTMMVLKFELGGVVETECARCGDPLEIEIEHSDRLVVKFGDTTGTSDDDILEISTSEHLLDLSQYLYEYAHLALPSRSVHEDEEDCNPDALDLLDDLGVDDDPDEPLDPRWDALKDLK
ncbi:MAG: DUF177 domain-containing protein [Cryomorphaceae bacterium]|nr:DUF177 domain-containing protein [Cryomorphaceae bacterium]